MILVGLQSGSVIVVQGDVLKNKAWMRVLTSAHQTQGNVKRDLLQCQKRPIQVSKETYYSVKRDLLVSKETYYKAWMRVLTSAHQTQGNVSLIIPRNATCVLLMCC